MPRKPSNLVYGVDERPHLGVILILAFQHLFFLGVGLVRGHADNERLGDSDHQRSPGDAKSV